ncbi:metal-responsive CopG/Arc/MetJ family transcriptional regulator [Bradyrhizobium japonicum]|uniref:hypothetical protein n=1 Tax=Bradyrhizobium japonicum TaxID=375 RepID=UPI0033933F4D
MSEAALSERVIIPMTEALVAAVDDFRFANRMPSRAEAIRHLLLAGLTERLGELARMLQTHTPLCQLSDMQVRAALELMQQRGWRLVPPAKETA